MSDTPIITISVPISGPRNPRLRALAELGRQVGDCEFIQTSCNELGDQVEYEFTVHPQTEKPAQKAPKKPRAKRGSLFSPSRS